MLSLIAALSLVACGGTATPPSGGWQNPDDDTDRPTHEQANILVVYFSVPDNVSNSYVEIDGRQRIFGYARNDCSVRAERNYGRRVEYLAQQHSERRTNDYKLVRAYRL